MTDAEIISGILKAEGGWVDHKNDTAGATNRGITLATYSGWLKRPATKEELATLTEDEARAIYRQLYIVEPGYVAIADDSLRAAVVDAGVNHGPSRATKMLQEALGTPPDGALGLITLTALGAANPRKVLIRFLAQRIRFYGSIITKNPTQAVFAKGWANRMAEQMEAAA